MTSENSPTANQWLTTHEAAARLRCVPDYVTKLCREGNLIGTRRGKAWFVDAASVAEFEVSRTRAKELRSRMLAHARAIEMKVYRKPRDWKKYALHPAVKCAVVFLLGAVVGGLVVFCVLQ